MILKASKCLYFIVLNAHYSLYFYICYENSKQNIIAKISMNTKRDKIEKLSKTLLFPSSAHHYIYYNVFY